MMPESFASPFSFANGNIRIFIRYLLFVTITIAECRISPNPPDGSVWTNKCPCKCDTDDLGRKRVICDDGDRESIPSHYMDKSAQILIFTAPVDKPNQVTIGRIFLEFSNLQEIYITYSNVPAIGDSSFWPGIRTQILDLSHNNITILRDTDFNGLSNLVILNLSDNKLVGSPSAPFRFLGNLTRLSLARNKLTKLVPRLFYRLEKLEFLDLSGNPLKEINHDDFKDLKPLRTLYMAGCQLIRLHSLIYQNLPNLEELDVRDNRFEYIAPEEFKHLKKLKILRLDGNKLSIIQDNAFNGHRLNILSLSRNSLMSISSCAFCNSSIKQLDISDNKFTAFNHDVSEPLSNSLSILYGENNKNLIDASSSVANLIKPLKMLRILSLAYMNIDDTVPMNLFLNQRKTLTSVNLSGNKFLNLSAKLFEGLKQLEEIDLSDNILYGLSENVINTFKSLPKLSIIYLHSNPWSCYRCYILPLLEWIETSPPAYVNACQKDNKGFCVKCSQPFESMGKELHLLDEWDLEWCADPSVKSRLSTTEPNVGLVLALLIIISLIIVIISVIIMYRKQGATYYTHEDELRFQDKTVFSVSSAVQRFANATASPPISPDSPDSPITEPSHRTACSVNSDEGSKSPSTRSQNTSPASSPAPSLTNSPPPEHRLVTIYERVTLPKMIRDDHITVRVKHE